MRIKLENSSVLSKAVELISELVTEVKIKINEYGLSITAIDPANVAMVGLRIPKKSFSEFDSGSEILGVNLDSLKKILKRSSGPLSLDKRENLLYIQMEDRIKRNFILSLIDIESEDKEIPNLEFSSRVELRSQDLIDSVEDCAVVADACSFIIKEDKFIIEAKGLNSTRTEFSGDEAKITAEECKARYSLEYLQKFIKASKLADKTTLNFADDHPLRMDVRTENLEISFILAPRVETED
ncbi:MAG: proliferating cell nuclear antigen (pcna) [Candidatus Pacearchaeota archaeon]|nr:proliferating cell nuclear antigen (pcna) [Candidatus Pacearchaeota archaeon]